MRLLVALAAFPHLLGLQRFLHWKAAVTATVAKGRWHRHLESPQYFLLAFQAA
jgi:hypothetical protein